ncbi:MAG: MFS transporter [Actinomycetota bacterium]|nr:MFS transporter [Actinomycetota bacterium]
MPDHLATVDPRVLRRWRRTVTGAFALGGIATSAWGPRLPAVKADLRIGTATIGVVLAGATAGALGGLLAASPLLGRFGSRRSVAGALVAVAASLALVGAGLTLGSLPLVAAAFVVVGAGIGTLDVAINVEGAAIERASGRTRMPMMHAAWSIGVGVGSGIGAACAAAGVDPAAQFAAEAAAIALVALVTASGIPAGRRAVAELAVRRSARVRRWLRGWLDGRLLLIGLVLFGVELGEGSANSWLALAARAGHGEPVAVAAAFLTVFAAGEALSRLFGGPVVDRLGRVATIRVTTALGAVGVVLFVEGSGLVVALTGVVLWSVGVSMGFPLGMSAAAESGPDPASRVSVVASVGYFAGLAGPPVVGALAQETSLLHALLLVAASLLAAFAVAGSLRTRR